MQESSGWLCRLCQPLVLGAAVAQQGTERCLGRAHLHAAAERDPAPSSAPHRSSTTHGALPGSLGSSAWVQSHYHSLEIRGAGARSSITRNISGSQTVTSIFNCKPGICSQTQAVRFFSQTSLWYHLKLSPAPPELPNPTLAWHKLWAAPSTPKEESFPIHTHLSIAVVLWSIPGWRKAWLFFLTALEGPPHRPAAGTACALFPAEPPASTSLWEQPEPVTGDIAASSDRTGGGR